MEFDNIFTAIQGRLHSAQKTLNSKFVDIIKSGDETSLEALTLIINSLKELNLPENYDRNIHLLFLLNTSFYSCTYIEDDKNYCHLIGAIPQISEYVYIKLVEEMDWHPYLGEAILYCPEVLTVDILKYLEFNLKLIQPKKTVPFIYSLFEALFKKVIITTCKQRRQRIVKYLLNMLKYDFGEMIEPLECTRELKYQYWGYVNKMYLELIEVWIKFMSSPVIFKPDIYDFTVEYDFTKWPSSTGETNWGKHCLGMIATRATESVRNITINMYMSWCEVDIPDSATEQTLQTLVREVAYSCREAVRSVAELYDSVAGLRGLEGVLENLALRPVTEDDEVAAADPNTLVMNILNPKKTQVKWLKGLIDRGIFESAPYMKVVADNNRLIDFETCELLLKKAIHYVSSTSTSQSDLLLIRDTVFKCIKALPPIDQLRLLENFLKEYGPSTVLCSDNFEAVLIALLNKMVLDNNRRQEVYDDIICLAFENSEGIISFCLRECLTSKQKSDLIIDVLEHVRVILCNDNCGTLSHINTFIVSTADQDLDQGKDICLHTVTSLCKKSLVDGKALLNNYVIPHFQLSIAEKKLSLTIFYQQIISALTQVENYSSTSLIALIAKTMNKLRPKVTSFSMNAAHFTNASSKLLTSLIYCFLKDKNDEQDSEILYLQRVACCLSPLTSRYMSLLWTKWGSNIPLDKDDPTVYWSIFGLGKGFYLTSLDQTQRFSLVSVIVKILPQLTMSEWKEIGCSNVPADKVQVVDTNASVFFILADCVLILFQLPFVAGNPPCLGNVLTNFIYFTQERIVHILNDMNEKIRSKIEDKIDQIANQLPEQLIKSKMPQIALLQKSISEKSCE